MAQEILTMKQVLESKICPVSKNQLIKLIRYGEQKKLDRLPDGINYIRAMVSGNGTKRVRWLIAREEIEAWQERAKNKSILSANLKT